MPLILWWLLTLLKLLKQFYHFIRILLSLNNMESVNIDILSYKL
jgi:hypothetical protein